MKIKWFNIFKTIIFLAATYMVLYDFYYIVIYPILTTRITTFTWIGLITCILSVTYIKLYIEEIYNYIREEK